MSQEIQLSLTPPSSTLPQQSPSWSGPNPTALANAGTPATPLGRVHDALRGRYLFTAVLALIFAIIGGAAGAVIFHSGYASQGVIEIDPVIPTPELTDRIMPLYQAYIATTVNNLHSERVIREAMQSPEWKAHRPLKPEAYLGQWQKDLVIKMAPMSFNINVTYTDDHKDGREVAPIAVRSLIKAYENMYGEDDKKRLDGKIAVDQRERKDLEQRIAEDTRMMEGYLKNTGEDITEIVKVKWSAHVATEQQLKALRGEYQREQDALKKAEAEAKTTPPTSEELARVDPTMGGYVRARSELEIEVKNAEARGVNSPGAVLMREKLDNTVAAMEAYRQELNNAYYILWRIDGTGGVLVKKDLTLVASNVKNLEAVFNQETLELNDLSHRAQEIYKYRVDRQRGEEELIRLQKKLEDLRNEREMARTFKVVDYGGQASIASQKPLAFGALGFLAGGGFPVGIMILLSFMNPRFRFSDEATQHATSGLTLLGILPDLPDRLSDPEQASIAAHCVHQIRTMLQINTTGTDERRVFAITSAAPADGKTSLTLALGLSYAACGTRTLLIDCDLVGSGLTTRMNVASEEGVLEAISHRTLLEYVRSTDIADVSILPVGSNQHLHASTLSPAALRRLIEEAKKHFDTILIDTGPVLGSIEASLVAAAADAVVLTVSRGQQRPLVEKTVQHLKNIKANLAGLVFNRAQTADFDRSISGISLRSAAAGSAHNAPRMGPVARAVQSAFKPAGEEISD